MALSRRLLFAGLAVIAAAAVAAAGVWFFYVRSVAPPAVSLEGAVASLSATPGAAGGAKAAPTGAATASAAASPRAAGSAAASVAPGAPGTLTGTWQVAQANSFVGYRVQEQLAGFGANTAVGRTSNVTGTLQFDGRAITAVDVTGDMTTLKSDDSRRDQTLRRQGIETATFPTATFKLTQPIPIDQTPATGDTVKATAQGRLTLHGVTRDVAIPLQGQLTGGQLVVVGSLQIAFADYQITPPHAAAVLSVDDHGVLELQLVFTHSG
jgi:polyisoprenoid-binding protein YceI